jgi:hypothetical protein
MVNQHGKDWRQGQDINPGSCFTAEAQPPLESLANDISQLPAGGTCSAGVMLTCGVDSFFPLLYPKLPCLLPISHSLSSAYLYTF